MEYCNALSLLDGFDPCYSKDSNENWICNFNANGYRLPTEAEWEYAARGGTKGRGYKYSGSNNLNEVAWYYGSNGLHTRNVKTKAPNELGLYDMSGNVWEWCWDWYGNYSSSSQINPAGPSNGSERVVRGGSWFNDSPYDPKENKACPVASRGNTDPSGRAYFSYTPKYASGDCIGFRLVRSGNK